MRKQTKSELKKKHLDNLSLILKLSYVETKIIFKQLKDIEHKGQLLAEKYCNGDIDSFYYDTKLDLIKCRLKLLLSESLLKNVHLNGDPRGYFLKLNDDYVRTNKITIETDWGGYGIFCPENIKNNTDK